MDFAEQLDSAIERLEDLTLHLMSAIERLEDLALHLESATERLEDFTPKVCHGETGRNGWRVCEKLLNACLIKNVITLPPWHH